MGGAIVPPGDSASRKTKRVNQRVNYGSSVFFCTLEIQLGFDGMIAPSQNLARIGKQIMTSVIMDKWLCAGRFFKAPGFAARPRQPGRLESNAQPAKAAREVRIGDMLRVANDGGDFQVEVLLLSNVRGPASVAQTLYRETEASQELRRKVAAERKAMKQFAESPTSRPTKRDRRRIIQFRDRA